VLSGALPKYVTPVLDSAWGVAHGVRTAQVKSTIREVRRAGGRVSAVLVVSPTYFGVCSHIGDLKASHSSSTRHMNCKKSLI
jgi:arginine/lysine/ornithine decarboxylase